MKALVLNRPNELALEDRPVPEPGVREVLVRVRAASICHTDFFTLRGEYPDCKYPTVLGHEFSGTVEACGPGADNVKPGDRVACMAYSFCGTCRNCRRGRHNGCANVCGIPFDMDGAYQEFTCVSAEMAYPFDESLSFAAASLAEPAANGCSAADRAEILPGDHVVVIGPGPIGLLALQAARLQQPGTLTMLGTRPERLAAARRLGADQAIHVRECDPREAVMDRTGGQGADAILLCTGAQEAWHLAGEIAAMYGRIIVEALPDAQDAAWPVRVFDFTARHIAYLGVSGYNATQFRAALDLVQDGRIDAASLITHRFPLEEYARAFETSDTRREGAIKVVFEM